jgi:hypothetical protein
MCQAHRNGDLCTVRPSHLVRSYFYPHRRVPGVLSPTRQLYLSKQSLECCQECRPEFANPIHVAVKPAIRQLRTGIADTFLTDLLTS